MAVNLRTWELLAQDMNKRIDELLEGKRESLKYKWRGFEVTITKDKNSFIDGTREACINTEC